MFKSGKIPCKGKAYGWFQGFRSSLGACALLTSPAVLEPISTIGLTPADVDGLCTRTRELMLKEIINLTYEARGLEAPIAASTVHASGVDLKQ